MDKKAIILTSTKPRHLYFVECVRQRFEIASVILEKKHNYYTGEPCRSALMEKHFQRLQEYEGKFFGDGSPAETPSVVHVEDINAADCINIAVKQAPDVVCLFGTSILKGDWLAAFPGRIVNLHLGLSPFYKGSATLFWPFANRELEYLGTTIHLATAKVDSGNILARIPADLRPNENYYEITNRLIRDSIERFPDIVLAYLDGRIEARAQEQVESKTFRKADFTGGMLSRALGYVGDGLGRSEIERTAKARSCLFSL